MNKFTFSRVEALKFGLTGVIEKCGLWLFIVLGQLKILFMFFSTLVFVAGTFLLRFADTFFIRHYTTSLIDWALNFWRIGISTQRYLHFSSFQFVWTAIAFLFLLMLINSIWSLIAAKIAIDIYEKKKLTVTGVIPSIYSISCDFFAVIFYWVVVLLGLIFFIIPGLIIASRLWFFRYAVLDKGQGPIAALRYSWGSTRGQTVNLLAMIFLMNLIHIIAGVGIILSLPMMFLVNTYMYKKLGVKES